MTTITFDANAQTALLSELNAFVQSKYADDDAATKADFQTQRDKAQKAHDNAVAAAADALKTALDGINQEETDKASAIAKTRNLLGKKIAAGVAFAQTGQPVQIEVADETATTAA